MTNGEGQRGKKFSKVKVLPADLREALTFPITERSTRVQTSKFAVPIQSPGSLTDYLRSLPHILVADELRASVAAIVTAYRLEKPVIVGIGGHVIKCGLSPLLILLMERGVISGVMMNGGASIHDFEIALFGQTSEDVAENLQCGRFGMVYETGHLMNQAISHGACVSSGMGQGLGESLISLQAENLNLSVLATAVRLDIPIMVHIAIGGDTIHMHPDADGAALGSTSFHDFRLLVSLLRDIGDGGVYLNIGSSLILPEVFLKALNLARNLSQSSIGNLTTINMDMVQHYRPLQNVVKRPSQDSGKGYNLIGHHEIMVPLLVQLVLAGVGNTV
jgi:hypothetical protein